MQAKAATPAIMLLTALLLSSLTARADVKIVSDVTVTGIPAAATRGSAGAAARSLANKTVTTTYYKGTHQRIEAAGTVTIIDRADGGKTYSLDPAAKTYFIVDTKAAMDSLAGNPMLAALKIQPKVFLNSGGHSKVIAGKPATDYKWTAIMKFVMADGTPGGLATMLPTITLKGEQWTTAALTMPGGAGSGSVAERMGQNMTASGMPPFMASGMKAITEKLAAMKGAPLSSVVSVWFQFPEGSPAASMGIAPKEPIVTTTEVTAVSDESLADDLFAVPADYKKIDPPSMGLPGGLGGGDAAGSGKEPAAPAAPPAP